MNDLKSAIRSRLTASTALTNLLAGMASVYHLLAPVGATLDYIVFRVVTDSPENKTPTEETEYLIDIIAWADDGYNATAIREQIDVAMATDVSVSGYTNVLQWKERGIPGRIDEESGKPYYAEGSTFRVRLETN